MARLSLLRPLLLCLVICLTGCLAALGEPDGHKQELDPASADDGSEDAGAQSRGRANGAGADGNADLAATDPGDAADSEYEDDTPTCDDGARDLSIQEVALYQGVKITLAQAGAELSERNAPVVAGRPALVRVFVTPDPQFKNRKLRARLALSQAADKRVKVLEQQLEVNRASDDATLASTFNFTLSAEQVGEGTRYAVSLHETACPELPPSGTAVRFPETGLVPLRAQGPDRPFRVVLVPVRYVAEGANRTPQVNDAMVSALRDQLFKLYPVRSAEITVRTPMDWDNPIRADGTGWSQLLDQCVAQRGADGADAGVYYYCMFNPAPSFSEYCRGGCVAGLGFVPSVSDAFRRGSIGLGFGDAAGTMAHELGHALGRPHAPCGGADGPDPNFPYAGGKIGSWGYDLLKGQLIAPDNHTDMMGYCNGPWISDYNYQLIFERFQSVLTAAERVGAPVTLRSIVVDADLSLHLGHSVTLSRVPEGESVAVSFLDDAGEVLAQGTGSFLAVTHVAGGLLYIPEPPQGARTARIEGFGELAL